MTRLSSLAGIAPITWIAACAAPSAGCGDSAGSTPDGGATTDAVGVTPDAVNCPPSPAACPATGMGTLAVTVEGLPAGVTPMVTISGPAGAVPFAPSSAWAAVPTRWPLCG